MLSYQIADAECVRDSIVRGSCGRDVDSDRMFRHLISKSTLEEPSLVTIEV